MFNDLKLLAEHIRNAQIGEAMRDASRILNTAADLYDSFLKGIPLPVGDADGDLDLAVAELESCCGTLAGMPVGADPKTLDPATILLIVKSVIELIKWLRERRQNP